MPDHVFIGNFKSGLVNNVLPFNINNDAFPTLYNMYSWRGRVKRKRGTEFLGQLQRQLQSDSTPNNWQVGAIGTTNGAGNLSVNLITVFSLGSTSSITPGSITLTDGTNTYTEPATPNGTLVGVPGGTGTINYATGALTITGGALTSDVIGTFSYFPGLPVMGLRDYSYNASATVPPSVNIYPFLLAFDTKYSYQFFQSASNSNFYSVSFYKASSNPVTWSGLDHQLFWTTNYQGALWATNNKPGLHIQPIKTITVGNPTVIDTTAAHGLITGDYVWFNEITGADAGLLNGQTAQVTVVTNTQFTVAIDTTAKAINNSGIFQTLTATSGSGDGIRWYDGDCTATTGLPVTNGVGWVNFAPPLTETSVSIDDKTSALYYLVGALVIMPFKDRLLFFSPWIQTSSSGTAIQLADTVLWSWNGTPYYTTLTPAGETSNVKAYYQDQTGLGGNLPAGIGNPISTVGDNEDALLIGFGGDGLKARLIYSNNDFDPFILYRINSELPSDSTFSTVVMDQGMLDLGQYGLTITDQQSCSRIDLAIPDEVFNINRLTNGTDRVNAVRDFLKEWVYFSFPVDGNKIKFPTRTFLYNYRDLTWAVLKENFTAHGTFRPRIQKSWLTTGFTSWDTWVEPWNAGISEPFFPIIIGGTPQGYVLKKGIGTGESISGTIASMQDAPSLPGNVQITSIDHCVEENDYLYFSDAIGAIGLNGQIGRVLDIVDSSNFIVDRPNPSGTYLGLGKFTRLSQPLLQTKQFPMYWEEGRQARLSVQKYLMDRTTDGQVTVNIYLSTDPTTVWNDPALNVPPNSLVYSQLMYTCPESTNIGLTPSNVNLQTPTASSQFQIWHRINTSLMGSTFQIGITLNDAQMRDLNFATSEIALQGMQLTFERGPLVS